jgi:predicted nucleic acid-binding protein
MMYLLDTNIVSELRKTRVAQGKSGRADRHVTNWAKSLPAESMFLSAICILEIELGVRLMERRDPAQGDILRTWLEKRVLPAFAGRVLAIDTAVARQCAALHVPDPRSYRDSLIAATALVHNMTVVTRNETDFEHTGVAILNPWKPG